MVESRDDPVLGHLWWDEKLDWWIAEIDFGPNHRIELFVDYEGEAPQELILARARMWLARVQQREAEYRQWSARQLLTKRWNKEEAMTISDIENLLRLATIECSSDGGAKLYWDDKDVLFFGNNLYTQIGMDGECVEVRME